MKDNMNTEIFKVWALLESNSNLPPQPSIDLMCHIALKMG